jgi:hypothetical protein
LPIEGEVAQDRQHQITRESESQATIHSPIIYLIFRPDDDTTLIQAAATTGAELRSMRQGGTHNIMKTVMILALALASTAMAQPLAYRQEMQRDRIRHGLRSGSLTPLEARTLARRQAALGREIRRDRMDGGGLTQYERFKLDRKQDALSRQIRRESRDAQYRW